MGSSHQGKSYGQATLSTRIYALTLPDTLWLTTATVMTLLTLVEFGSTVSCLRTTHLLLLADDHLLATVAVVETQFCFVIVLVGSFNQQRADFFRFSSPTGHQRAP